MLDTYKHFSSRLDCMQPVVSLDNILYFYAMDDARLLRMYPRLLFLSHNLLGSTAHTHAHTPVVLLLLLLLPLLLLFLPPATATATATLPPPLPTPELQHN